MDDANIVTWWAKELAEHLNIGSSTLRKWSLELEQAGYKFLRDEHNRRAYVEHDALALRQLKTYLDGGMTYDLATKAVTAEYMRTDSTEITPYAKKEFPQEQPNDKRYDELTGKMDVLLEMYTTDRTALIEMNKELMKRLDERDNFIKEQLTELNNSQKALPAASSTEIQKALTEDMTDRLKELKEELQETIKAKPTKVFNERPWLANTLMRLIKK